MIEILFHRAALPLVSIAALLSGCRRAPAPPPPPEIVIEPAASRPTAAPEDAGQCPSLEGFRVAASNESIERGVHRWLLHEVLVPNPKEPVETSEEHPIAEPEARARGASSSDGPVWLLNHGAAPCRMKPAGFVFQRHNIGPQFERVARVLEGPCAYQGSPGRTIAFQQAAEPARCRFPQTNEMAPLDVPDGLVPKKPCKAPGCRYDTQVSGGGVGGGAAVVSMIATWLHPTREPECNWAHDDFYGVFMRTRSGGPFVEVPGVQLTGALIDDRGLRAVVGDSLWTMTVVPIGPAGQPGKAIAVTTHVNHEEDREWNSMAPYCGP